MRELRQRVRPFRAESFSLNLSGGFAVCGRRDVAAPAAGAKRKGHLRFPFLFELLPFPCWDSLGADGRLRKQEKDAAVGLLLRVFLRLFAVHRQRTATHIKKPTQRAARLCRPKITPAIAVWHALSDAEETLVSV